VFVEQEVARSDLAPWKTQPRPLRLAVLPDFAEENWPSMDLCADMLMERMNADLTAVVHAELVRPPFRNRFRALPGIRGRSWAFNGDRFLNRHWYFPGHVARRFGDYDAFHICDHSYSQLALRLPADRTGIFCHDLDTFRCLLTPEAERRPLWFRWMTRRILRGLQSAAVIFHTTRAVGEAIVGHGLAAREKLVCAPLGHASEFRAEPERDPLAERILGDLQGKPYLLHVGSCIPRKRVDFLLQVFAQVRSEFPALRLLKIGGTWSAEHRSLIGALNLKPALIYANGIERSTLAVLYRHAAVVLLPSDAEGFGLPVVEALACGSPVLASDLATLREVGGTAAMYAPVGDLNVWRAKIVQTLCDPMSVPARADRLAQAERFTWENHARIIAETYRRLVA
jgi:glycosyltransferase involved in cell wall biosynthesis